MTRILISILFGLLTSSLLGQNLNYKDYFTNDQEVFSNIDSNYSFYFIRELRIDNLTETKFTYDTLGNIIDSSIVNHYDFDSLGRIVEHRFDYRMSSTKYRSEIFTYSEDGTINKIYNNPFGHDYALGGSYFVSSKLPMYCEYRNSSYQIETINIKTGEENDIYTMKYYYNQNLFVKYFYYNEYLISGLDFLKGDKLVYRHKMSFEQKKH